jgi:hypothetical protein
MYILSRWAYKLLRPYIVELVDVRKRLKWDKYYRIRLESVIDILDTLFEYDRAESNYGC